MKCTVIIVTYNSHKHIHKTIACLRQQTLPPYRIIIVDTGSDDRKYLSSYHPAPNMKVVWAEPNSGFCKGNNVGMEHVPDDSDYVFFLNPDAFITPRYIEKAIAFMEDPNNQKCAAVTGKTLGYDIEVDTPTQKYDTTGVFRRWYGRWYDRSQGEKVEPEKYCDIQELPAICGAVYFCRKKALDTVLIRGREIFDNKFYMYKEDVDLSIRLRKRGWKLMFLPDLVAYHCRGWNRDRLKMPRKMRLASAKNELRVQRRSLSAPGFIYACLKYGAVKLFNI